MVRTLGLDLGASCGYSVVENDGTTKRIVASGVLRFDKGPKGGQRKARVVEGVQGLIDTFEPDIVAVERVDFMKFRLAYAAHCEYRSLVEYAAFTRNLDVLYIGVSQLKKWATGKGKATKQQMCGAVSRIFPEMALTARKPGKKRGKAIGTKAAEDEADAILVAVWASDRNKHSVI